MNDNTFLMAFVDEMEKVASIEDAILDAYLDELEKLGARPLRRGPSRISKARALAHKYSPTPVRGAAWLAKLPFRAVGHIPTGETKKPLTAKVKGVKTPVKFEDLEPKVQKKKLHKVRVRGQMGRWWSRVTGRKRKKLARRRLGKIEREASGAGEILKGRERTQAAARAAATSAGGTYKAPKGSEEETKKLQARAEHKRRQAERLSKVVGGKAKKAKPHVLGYDPKTGKAVHAGPRPNVEHVRDARGKIMKDPKTGKRLKKRVLKSGKQRMETLEKDILSKKEIKIKGWKPPKQQQGQQQPGGGGGGGRRQRQNQGQGQQQQRQTAGASA